MTINNEVSLDDFIEYEAIRLRKFKQWYEYKNKQEPENYPLSYEPSNGGVWCEQLDSFDHEDSQYFIPKSETEL
jgi:hypothetical protein